MKNARLVSIISVVCMLGFAACGDSSSFSDSPEDENRVLISTTVEKA